MNIGEIKKALAVIPDDYDSEIFGWFNGIPIIRPISSITIDKSINTVKFEVVLNTSGEA